MRRRSVLTALAGAALTGAAPLLAGCTEDPGPRPRLSLATGENGGVYQPLGRALGTTLDSRWRVEAAPTAGSVENLERLRTGRAQVAFTSVDVAAQDLDGLGSFGSKYQLRALGELYADHVHLLIATNRGAYGVDGLAGRPVSTGAAGSGTEVVATRLFAAAGITLRGFEQHKLGLRDSIAALRAGIIDAFFFSSGLPCTAIAELVASGDLEVGLIDLSSYVPTLQSQYGEVYSTGWIPNSIYTLTSVSTVAIANVLAVPAAMSESAAYQLTRLLFVAKPRLSAAHPEGRQLDPRSALGTYPVPLHPGAERFYREQKAP
ncbi:TAXI family TRAP transporter solute-binding subunit [Actinocatenispora sera]|uniref:TAXI family TRAP transporter solute-binding subunit n=1 Tax=Actinocatenispora sera TaxID=390989 RepID=UPI000A07297C|nr:TAXI family TRAP transporter solute-binding subunit [Actinocatenispora sera]